MLNRYIEKHYGIGDKIKGWVPTGSATCFPWPRASYCILSEEDVYFVIKIFWLIVDSHVVLRNNAEKSHVPFTQFPPMITPSKNHNQYVDIGIVKTQSISITTGVFHVAHS